MWALIIIVLERIQSKSFWIEIDCARKRVLKCCHAKLKYLNGKCLSRVNAAREYQERCIEEQRGGKRRQQLWGPHALSRAKIEFFPLDFILFHRIVLANWIGPNELFRDSLCNHAAYWLREHGRKHRESFYLTKHPRFDKNSDAHFYSLEYKIETFRDRFCAKRLQDPSYAKPWARLRSKLHKPLHSRRTPTAPCQLLTRTNFASADLKLNFTIDQNSWLYISQLNLL